MLGPEVEGEIAQGVFGHRGLASAPGSTPAVDSGSNFARPRSEPLPAAAVARGQCNRYLAVPTGEVVGETAMSALTRKEVTAMLGELDDDVVAEIIATGATPEELAEAHAWLANDEPLMNAGRPLPSGRVARVVDIIAAISEEEEQEDVARRS